MKLLIVGDWHSDLHEEELSKSFKRLGYEVQGFKWFHYFSGHFLSQLTNRAQNKFLWGPLLYALNTDLINTCMTYKPDLVFVYRGTHIFPESLQKIKSFFPHCTLFGYNNDDPFSPKQPSYYWRHFIAGIPYYDVILAYRHSNIEEFKRFGAKKVGLLRSWFVPDRSYPVELQKKELAQLSCDVVFIGHYEPDNRLACFEEIIDQGFSFHLYGPPRYWASPLKKSKNLQHLDPIRMVWGDDYNNALCASKIALCFLSKLNRDTYTRRCFEIPATQTFMLSEYSNDLASLYEEGKEAEYFRSPAEMIDKIRFYTQNDTARQKIAAAGYKKVYEAGHDIDSRIKDLIRRYGTPEVPRQNAIYRS